MAVTNVGVLFQGNLAKAIFMGYKEEIGILNAFYNNSSSADAFVEWTGIVAPGQAEEKPKGVDMTYKNILVETPKRITQKTFALGIRCHFEDQRFDKTGALKRLAEAVGRSQKVAEEVYRATLFNLAGSTVFRTGYDGQALLSATHPLSGDYAFNPSATAPTTVPSRTITTWSNYMAADLSYISLGDMITQMRRTVTREGDFANITPRKLLIPPESEMVAYEITKSLYRPDQAVTSTVQTGVRDTGSNLANALSRFGLQIVSSPYLLDTDSFFLQSDKHDLQFFRNMELTVRNNDSIGSWDKLVESMQIFALGFHDPRGICGSVGG